MSLTELERPVAAATQPVASAPPVAEPPTEPLGDATPTMSAARIAVVGGLSSAAAGIVLGGLFDGRLGRVVGVAAAALGALVVAAGLRGGRTWVQYLAVPAVFVGGYVAALVLPNPTGVHGTVPQLVRQAISNGGLAHPPVPFDPGWRFLLVALVGITAAAGVSLAAGFGKPRLAIMLPLPLVLAGALNQPKGHELIGGGVALALMLAALSASYSAELAGRAEVGRRFELRQVVTSLLATAVALALLAGLSHLSVLFPQPGHSSAAQPQKPKIVPLSQIRDRPLFDAPSPGPWQVGVFTVYQDGSWLLPPFDAHAVLPLGADGKTPDAPSGPTATSALTVRQIGGFTLPTPAEPVAVSGTSVNVGYDEARSVFRLREGAAAEGMHYTVTSRRLPSGDELSAAAQKSVPAAMRSYLTAPAAPTAITALLAKSPSANPWDRLQTLRHKLYTTVVARSSGLPVAVTPATIVNELNGGNATPFEIVAAEAVLSRWAGLPSRIGYGYYDASKPRGGDFHPRDGANWLEVWFDGYGWVPILGTPLKAQSDLSAQHKSTPQIRPAQNQSLQIYVPVLKADSQLAFEVVRFYAVRIVPVLLLLWLLWRAVALPARRLRARRRAAWAAVRGPAGRIAVAYANFRDQARDLGLDDGRSTPIEFLDRVEPDTEHRELAWLTTRALWGDLVRDLRPEDAVAAEQLSRSMVARMARAQSGLTRVGALSSRASLRDPWDAQLPNAWPHLRLPRVRLPRLRLPRRLLVATRLRRAEGAA
jgi:hypothetical protein